MKQQDFLVEAAKLFKKKTTRKKTMERGDKVVFHVKISKIDEDKQLVYGEVYAPHLIDTHGDMMLPDDVEIMAHKFMNDQLQYSVDVMHNNKVIEAIVVESFVAKGHPEYNEGAWVAVTKIHDDDIWLGIKAGIYNGYSIEAMVVKVPALVEIDVYTQVFGLSEENSGHTHAFFVEMDDEGDIIGGRTSDDEGHYHVIRYGTATEREDGHSHRYFLP